MELKANTAEEINKLLAFISPELKKNPRFMNFLERSITYCFSFSETVKVDVSQDGKNFMVRPGPLKEGEKVSIEYSLSVNDDFTMTEEQHHFTDGSRWNDECIVYDSEGIVTLRRDVTYFEHPSREAAAPFGRDGFVNFGDMHNIRRMTTHTRAPKHPLLCEREIRTRWAVGSDAKIERDLMYCPLSVEKTIDLDPTGHVIASGDRNARIDDDGQIMGYQRDWHFGNAKESFEAALAKEEEWCGGVLKSTSEGKYDDKSPVYVAMAGKLYERYQQSLGSRQR